MDIPVCPSQGNAELAALCALAYVVAGREGAPCLLFPRERGMSLRAASFGVLPSGSIQAGAELNAESASRAAAPGRGLAPRMF